MLQENFHICVDDDYVDIVDWIDSHFKNGNWHKNFEVTVSIIEIDYDDEGGIDYLDK